MAKITIYIKPSCPYCIKALRLLDDKAVEYQLIDITDNSQRRAEMQAVSGGHTVPQIIINQQAIGGCDDLLALDQQGKLDQLLT